jgi:hypothetical protein
MLEGYAATVGIKLAGKFLFPIFASQSPFLAEEYRSYFRGGLQDMATWVAHCWQYLVRWLEEGPSHHFCKSVDFDWTKQDVIKTSAQKRDQILRSVVPRFIKKLFSKSLVLKTRENRKGVLLSSTLQPKSTANRTSHHEKSIFSQLKQNFIPALKSISYEVLNSLKEIIFGDPCRDGDAIKKQIQIQSDIPFASFGKSVVKGRFYTNQSISELGKTCIIKLTRK